jgi:hypothetical protein
VEEKAVVLQKEDDSLKELKNPNHLSELMTSSEPLHPLEAKYGKEPRINPEDLWHWH